MIHIKFVIYDNEKDKIKKVVAASRFRDDQETEAQLYINTMDFKKLFSRCTITSNLRHLLIYRNTKTGETSLESLD